MTFSLPVYALYGSGLLALALAVFILIRFRTSVAIVLGLMALTVAVWSFGDGTEIAADLLENKVKATQISVIGYTFAPYLWFLVTREYSRKTSRRKGFNEYWLALAPLLNLIVLWAGESYHLGLYNPRVQTWQGLNLISYSHGPWFWVHTVVSYLFILGGTITLLHYLRHESGLYRAQSLALIVSAFMPWVGNIIHFALNTRIDPTAFVLMLAIGILFWAIFGYRLMDIAPLARDVIMENMREGMIVLNVRGSVIDINIAAAAIIGVPVASAIGRTAAEIFQPWPDLIDRFRNVMEASFTFAVGEGEAARPYQVRLSPLQEKHGQLVGRIIMLRSLDDEVPLPGFDAEASALLEPILSASDQPERASNKQIPLVGWLVDFFRAPARKDLAIPPGVNPMFFRDFERGFTIIIRVSALLATINTFFAEMLLGEFSIGILVVLWITCLARSLPFKVRAYIFLLVIYAWGLVENFRLGLSTQSFFYYLLFIIAATLLIHRRAGLVALLISMTTLSVFGYMMAQGVFVPLAFSPNDFSFSAHTIIPTLVAFILCSIGLSLAVAAVLDFSNRAWQLESQVSNLLRQERNLLEQRVLERTSDLAQARDQALEASRFKSQLVAKVSHELRTPLGGVLGYAELLEQGAYGALTPKQRSAASDIVASANYLSVLINELLDQAQIEARAVKIYLYPFEPAHLLEGVEKNMMVLALNKGLRFVCNLDPALPPKLIGDERRLQQVLFNLAGNAIKFTDRGEVNVSLIRYDETHWMMRVSDTGIGIPQEAQTYIFESFRQVDNPLTRNAHGTGLGLSITKQLIEMMDGKIELESEAEQGSTFTVLLPMQIPEEIAVRCAKVRTRNHHAPLLGAPCH